MGIPDHLTYLLRNLYAGQEATVRTGHGTSPWVCSTARLITVNSVSELWEGAVVRVGWKEVHWQEEYGTRGPCSMIIQSGSVNFKEIKGTVGLGGGSE